ncbi:MAG: BT4734/BF3469 family protein [Lutibacter sp.]
MSNVTLFKNSKSPANFVILDSEEILNDIKNGKYETQINKLNSFKVNSEEQASYKSSELPAVAWNGIFTYRQNDKLVEHSGLVAIDFDHIPIEEQAIYREKLTGDPYTYALFKSPRQDGLKCIVRIPADIENHRLYVRSLKTHYSSPYYDHFEDEARLCYVSYDPNLYHNYNAVTWTQKEIEKKQVQNEKQSRAKPISNNEANPIFENLVKWEINKQNYYQDGNKHKFLVSLFAACCRYGIDQVHAVELAYDRFNNIDGTENVDIKDFEKIASQIYSLYNHQFGTAKFEPTPSKIVQQKNEVNIIADKANHTFTDPVSWFNWNKLDYIKELLIRNRWILLDSDEYAGETDNTPSAKFGAHNFLYVYNDSLPPFKKDGCYSLFQVLTILKFGGDYTKAINYISTSLLKEKIPYVRIGIDYFKIINKTDRFGISGTELKKWTQVTITNDFGKPYLSKIEKFDNFCIVPDNFDYAPVINNCYNLYSKFRHTPIEGDPVWSIRIMEHVFGDQLNLGLRYLQALYLHPDKILPILVLISKERSTGKTTFLNWLNMIFGDNMAVISPDDLINGFNSTYAISNILAVEETLIEKNITVEKIKALATGKFIAVNTKYVSQYKIPFYGKIIMTSNNEDKFARIDTEEIRFFVRKLGKPKFTNHNIESDLIKEIPAFLFYLKSLPAIDFTVGRVPFTPEELKNDNLTEVKKESRTNLYKELVELFTDHFENMPYKSEIIYATPLDIKNKWFLHNNNIGTPYIKWVLKNEFDVYPIPSLRYNPFGEISINSKTGTPYVFTNVMFNVDIKQKL